MILNKYTEIEKVQIRGYSSTCIIEDSSGNLFFAKWIKGIKKDSPPGKILFDKLRHLKKAEHSVLPKIIDYDWEETQQAYCIISEYKNVESLEDAILKNNANIDPVYFLKGIENLINCLQFLQKNYRLTHGDITPANILVDDNYDFYLIDFGISDIAATLSQEQNLEIFAKQFAAPEKWDRSIRKGFPHLSDIYSLGKIIEWFFEKQEIEEYEEINNLINRACEKEPEKRFNYTQLAEKVTKAINGISFSHRNIVYSENTSEELLRDFNDKDFKPLFDISPSTGENILLNIITKNFNIHCKWKISENRLYVLNEERKEENEENYKKKIKYAKKLGIPVIFSNSIDDLNNFSLTPIFKKIQKEKQIENEYRKGKKEIYSELSFFKELLNKEKEVLENNSLRLQYLNYSKEGDYEISFEIKQNEKYSKNSIISFHIDKSLPPNPEEFEYIVSDTADKNQMKDPLKFSGIAYDFDNEKRILYFKDCEKLDLEKIPKKGYLFENISKKEEEKKRQLEAIKKVEHNEAQSRDLIHYLFNPKELESKYLDIHKLEKIFQKDEDGKDYQYSYNQQKAIINAIHRNPLTVIQGPPGTGKTTVITEIIFQLLNAHPDSKILVTSQTNDAVDNVLDNLLKKDIQFVRLSGVRKPKENMQKHILERKIEGWKQKIKEKSKQNWETYQKQIYEKLITDFSRTIYNLLVENKEWKIKQQHIRKILERYDEGKSLISSLKSEEDFIVALTNQIDNIDLKSFFERNKIHKDWLTTISSLDEKSNINQKLVESIQVIGATTNHIAAKKYERFNFEFDYVIMDESGKATTAEALIPLTLGNNAILVGDHRQLRPMLTSNNEVEKWLREKYKSETDEFDSWDDYFNRPSIFEQIITKIDDDYKSQLDECRRCSAEQIKLISECFYEPFGDDKINPVDRSKEKEHNLNLKVNSSIIFLDIGNNSKSEINESGSSYNKESAKLVPMILKELDKQKIVKDYSIGIITGYTAQLRQIKREVKNEFGNRKLTNINLNSTQIAISVVDKFQGLEKDIIIFDLVRSRQPNLGFLSNANRINVALSRQKKLLIIIGNLNGILNAKPPQSMLEKNHIPALHKYLKALKTDWIVNSIGQIF